MGVKDWVKAMSYDDELQYLINHKIFFTPDDQRLLEEIASKQMTIVEAKLFLGVN